MNRRIRKYDVIYVGESTQWHRVGDVQYIGDKCVSLSILVKNPDTGENHLQPVNPTECCLVPSTYVEGQSMLSKTDKEECQTDSK